MSQRRHPVLLGASIDALGIARMPKILWDAGASVTLVGPRGFAVNRSRYIAKHEVSERGPVAVAGAMRKILARSGASFDRVIFGDEPLLWAAADSPERGWLKGIFPVPLEGRFKALLDSKTEFLEASRVAGLPVPRFEVRPRSGDMRSAAAALGYPLYIKIERGLAGSGLSFVRSEQEFNEARGRFEGAGVLMLQRPVTGRSGSISVFYRKGVPLCWFGYLMKETWPNRFSSASTIEIFDHPDIELLTTGVGNLTQFDGFGGIDWVHDEASNRLVLLEFNPRPTPVFYQGPKAGVDFSRALKESWDGNGRPQKPTKSGAVVTLFPQNFYRAVDDRNLVSGLRTFADAPWDDPGLLVAKLRRVVTHFIVGPVRRALGRG
jgi:hypothetical protein